MSAQWAEQPGAVVRHITRVGAVVSAGDPVLVVETMKFEAVVVADTPGVVDALAPLGEVVAVGSRLCDIRSHRPEHAEAPPPVPVPRQAREPVEGRGAP